MPVRPKAVLFDLDGVLLDTEPLYTRATQAVVSKYGRNYDFSLKRRIMGGSAMVGAKVVVAELGLPITPEQYLDERRQYLNDLFLSTQAIDGAERLVQTLAAKGYPLAVATSSERQLFELKTRQHAWFSLFTKVVCGDDPRIAAPKPAPFIFLLAASELGVSANECVAFEDSPAGVNAAHAAGCKVIARRDPQLSEDELRHACRIIMRYDELDLETFPERLSNSFREN